MASTMLFSTAIIFTTTICCALASQIEIPGKPILISPCARPGQPKCPELPPYMVCAEKYIPKGKCCPVCACKDYQGRSFPAGSAFLLEKVGSYCKQCTCSRKNGVLFAECFKFYCESLTCPPSYQEPRPNTCCKRCRSDWRKPVTTSPTFPPPFPNGGFPQPGGGFPQPGGGFPRPGGGFPQPGGGFPRPGGGFPRPGGGFPRPGGGFPRPGAGDEVAPSFGDEKIVENIAGEESVKRKAE